MATLYAWDPEKVTWVIPSTPRAYMEDGYHKTSGYVYNENVGRYMKLWGEGLNPPKVPFSQATTEEIKLILDGYYAGLLDVRKYWSIGDTRIFHIDEIEAGVTGETQPAQDIEMRIVDFSADTLSTPRRFRTKAAISLVSADVLKKDGYIDTSTNSTGWLNTKREKWCNTSFLNALNEDDRSLIQSVSKKTIQASNNRMYLTDNSIWIPSSAEFTGNNSIEGDQYAYYRDGGKDTLKNDRMAAGIECIEPEEVTPDNINDYFLVEYPHSYPFVYDTDHWTSDNKGKHSTTASMKLIAQKSCIVDLNSIYLQSESGCDKGTIYSSSTSQYIINSASGSYSGTYPGLIIKKGEYLQFSYSKDGSVNTGADSLNITFSIKNAGDSSYITRTGGTGANNQLISVISGEIENYNSQSKLDNYFHVGFCI